MSTVQLYPLLRGDQATGYGTRRVPSELWYCNILTVINNNACTTCYRSPDRSLVLSGEKYKMMTTCCAVAWISDTSSDKQSTAWRQVDDTPARNVPGPGRRLKCPCPCLLCHTHLLQFTWLYMHLLQLIWLLCATRNYCSAPGRHATRPCCRSSGRPLRLRHNARCTALCSAARPHHSLVGAFAGRCGHHGAKSRGGAGGNLRHRREHCASADLPALRLRTHCLWASHPVLWMFL